MSFTKENLLQKNPYPGIRSFEIEESHLFFGRDEQIEDLYNILNKTHFIAITGASGSGKSSLVKAGLIPRLYRDKGKWLHHMFRPGNNPIGNFAKTLNETLTDQNNKKVFNSIIEIENFLKNEDHPVEKLFSSVQSDKSHLIYIDQFEEIFRYQKGDHEKNYEKETEKFVDILIKASKITHLPVFIIITLRTDFLSDCSNFTGLTRVINEGHYLIPRMTLTEKEKALTGPAKYVGTQISENLKNLINKQLREFDVSLPVFQHALMRTWDYWLENAEYGKEVDVEHYEAVGTVTDALSVHAEYVYSTLIENRLKLIAEKIFRSLTHLGDDNRGTRSPKTLSEIHAIVDTDLDSIVTVIDKFRDEKNGFLLPPTVLGLKPETIIDISHESIMRIWERLVQWVHSETESAQLYLRLSKNAELYQEGKTGLLKNPDLQLALKWKDQNKPNEIWAQRYDPAFDRAMTYLDHSQKIQENEIRAKEEKQKRGLKRARFFAIFLGSASIISILFMVIALNMKFKADDSKREALDKEKLATQKSIIAEEKQREAISHKRIAEQQKLIAEEQRLIAEENKLYAVNQQKEAIYQKQLALLSKQEAIYARDIARDLQFKAEKLRDEAFQQKTLAENQRLRAVMSEAKTDTLRKLAIANSLSSQAVKIFRNNKKIQKLSEYDEQLPIILALQAYHFNAIYNGNPNDPDIFFALSEVSESGTVLRGNNMHTDGVRDVKISKNGKKFVSSSDDGTVRIFDFEKPEKSVKLNTGGDEENSIRNVDLDESGKTVIAGTYNGDIYFWKNTDLDIKAIILKGHTGIVNAVDLSEDGNFAFSVSNDGTVRLWDLQSLNSKIILTKNEKFTDISFSPSGKKYAISTDVGNIYVITDNDTQNPYIIKDTTKSKISCLIWKDEEILFAGYFEGYIRKIVNNSFAEEIIAHQSAVSSIYYENIFGKLISSSYDGTIKIWNANDIKVEPVILIKHNGWVYCAAATPDGNNVISGGADKQIMITPINAQVIITNLRKNVSKNMKIEDWYRFVGKDIDYSEDLP